MKRKAWFRYETDVELGVGKRWSCLKVWAYGKRKKYACRLEISGAGVAVYTGKSGNKKVVDLSWEKFIERLEIPK